MSRVVLEKMQVSWAGVRALLAVSVVALAACVPSGPPDASDRDAGLKMPPDGGNEARDAGLPAGTDGGDRDAGEAPYDGGVGMDADLPDALPMPDMDNDGIPDDEDPAPGSPNTLLFSDTFEEVGPRWLFSSVSMRIEPGESVLKVPVLEPFEREGWIGPEPAWGDYLIRTLVRVGRVGTSASAQSGHAGVIARVSQVTPSRYVTCGIDLRDNEIVLAEHEGTRRTTLSSTPATFETGDWLQINFRTTNQFYSCTVDGVELTASSGTFFAGSVGFRSFDATFAADWIEVYEIF